MVTTRSQSLHVAASASQTSPKTTALKQLERKQNKPTKTKTTKKAIRATPTKKRIPPLTTTNTTNTNLIRPLSPSHYGLVQERIRHLGPYALLVQAILWNQTHGRAALPVLSALLTLHPNPTSLATAPLATLTALLQPIGLHNIRARRLIALANAWLAAPPCKERRYRRLHYPRRGSGADVARGEVLGVGDEREGWEVAHLPGVGAYAIDSFRIFGRDEMRGVTGVFGEEGGEEWRRVVPGDKELRAYLRWRWAGEGWDWDPLTGRRVRMDG